MQDLLRVFYDLQQHARLWDDTVHLSPEGSDHLGDVVFEAIRSAGL